MPTQTAHKQGRHKTLHTIILEAGCILLFTLFMLPFAIVLLNSMRSNAEIIQSAAGFPADVTRLFHNIQAMFTNATFSYFSAFRDSVIITVLSLAVISIVSSMAAWVLVRNKHRWSKLLFMLFVAAMVIPFQVIMFPLISWFKKLGNALNIQLLRSYAGMVVAYLGFGEPLSIFIFHGFIKNVPLELEEAADIDGCSRPAIFFRIVLPLLQPVFVTILVLNGLWIWNDYLLPLLVLGSSGGVRTIPLAVQVFIGTYVKQWDMVMTSTLLAMIPIIVLYLFMQKYIVKGMVDGAIK